MHKWLDKLDREEIDKFLVNFANHKSNHKSKEKADEYLNENHKTAFDFLGGAFIWSDTPEGHHYWNNILQKLEK